MLEERIRSHKYLILLKAQKLLYQHYTDVFTFLEKSDKTVIIITQHIYKNDIEEKFNSVTKIKQFRQLFSL